MKRLALTTLTAAALLLAGCAAPAATATVPDTTEPTATGRLVIPPVLASALATPKPTVTWSAPPVLKQAVEPTPTASATIAPAAAKVAQAPKQEDDPGWDCHKDGNLICGPTSAEQQAEAWNNFDTAGFTEDELAKPFRVTYRGTTLQTSILADGHEWYLAPSSTKGLDHVFELEFGVTK